MTTAERELNQNTNFDWNRTQEKGMELEPLFGPGFTGLSNLGNRYIIVLKREVRMTLSFLFETILHKICLYLVNMTPKLVDVRLILYRKCYLVLPASEHPH